MGDVHPIDAVGMGMWSNCAAMRAKAECPVDPNAWMLVMRPEDARKREVRAARRARKFAREAKQ